MARPLIAALAPEIELAPGYILRITALNPSTGATVSGVTISAASLQVQTMEAFDDFIPSEQGPVLFAYGPG